MELSTQMCSIHVRPRMSAVSIETFNPLVHRDHMPEIPSPKPVRKVLTVRVGRFQLEFLSRAQFDAAIAYFHSPSGSTRLAAGGGDHWEFQPWQSRLPAGINNGHNRPKVLAALIAARKVVNEHLP